MSSDEDYCPLRESTNGLRRSQRIIRSDKKIFRYEVPEEIEEKPAKKPAKKKKSKLSKRPRLSESRKKDESSESFNGSYLTPKELQQLFIKFKRDGHFHLNPSCTSPPPLVISRTSNGKCVTTKIECYKTKRKFVNDLASNFTAHKDESEDPEAAIDRTSVTFTSPLTEKSCGYSVPTIQRTADSLPSPHRNFGAENEYLGKSEGPNLHPSSYSTAGNSQGNGSEISSCSSAFPSVNSARQTVPVRPNSMLVGLASNAWIPPSQTTLENRNAMSATGIYFPINSAQYSSTAGSNQAKRFDRNNSTKNSPETLGPLNLPHEYNYSNFNAADFHVTSYQQREASAQNSFCSSNNWNAASQTSSNPFYTNISTISTSTNSPMYYVPPRVLAYNPDVRGVNNFMHDVSLNNNSSMSDGNGHRSSFTAWNNGDLCTNSYIAAVDMPYYNLYNAVNASERCETAAMPMISGQVSMGSSQSNSWSENKQANKDYFEANGNSTVDSLPTVLNNFPCNATMLESSNVPGPRATDSETGLSQSSNEQTENLALGLENLSDSQNSELCSIVPSDYSFDYGIGYDNYMGGHLYGNEDLAPTTQGNDFSSKLPSVTSIKNEMRSWYGGNNGRYTSNDRSLDAADVSIYDFDTKENLITSFDHYLAEKTSRS